MATSDYELVLMLDPAAPDERRDAVAGETRQRIESDGALKHADSWGTRKLAYEIRQRTEADYRFYRFEGEGELLEQLDHALKITDGVLRFRIFKVDAQTPAMAPPPTAQPAGVGARAARAERRQVEQPPPQPGAEPGTAEAAAEPPQQAAEAAETAQPAEPEAEAPQAADEQGGEAQGGEAAPDEQSG